MALKIIVSYDDTDYDRDALALGRLLAGAGDELSLAYVCHSFGGALEEAEAEVMLARGAASVGLPDLPRHVVVNPGTSVGLTELAEHEGADIIVFGSEYRTAPGIVKPGISAHKLLLGGPAAIAVAPAGLHNADTVSIGTVGIIDEGDPSARETANSLAAALGASLVEHGSGPVDLLVVGAPSQFQIDDAAWRTLIGSDRATVMARYGQDAPNRRLEEAVSHAGIRYVDLLPGMRRATASESTPLYFEKDGHWTATGHAVAARLIASYVHEQGLLEADNEPVRLATAHKRAAP